MLEPEWAQIRARRPKPNIMTIENRFIPRKSLGSIYEEALPGPFWNLLRKILAFDPNTRVEIQIIMRELKILINKLGLTKLLGR